MKYEAACDTCGCELQGASVGAVLPRMVQADIGVRLVVSKSL